jgi:hypothetical protein
VSLAAQAATGGAGTREDALRLVAGMLAPTPAERLLQAAQAASELWAPAIVQTALVVGSPAPAMSWRGLRSKRPPAAAPAPDRRVNDGILALVDAREDRHIADTWLPRALDLQRRD